MITFCIAWPDSSEYARQAQVVNPTFDLAVGLLRLDHTGIDGQAFATDNGGTRPVAGVDPFSLARDRVSTGGLTPPQLCAPCRRILIYVIMSGIIL